MDGENRHFRLVPSLPPSSISNIELRRTKKMFGCFSLWKKKMVQNSKTKLTDDNNKSNKDLVASKN